MKIASISKVTLFPQSESLEKDGRKASLLPLQQLHQKSVWFIIILALLIRLPLLLTPLSYSSDTWRQADTASIAHNFVGSYNLLYPQIHWGGSGPGYVETEFQLYPFIVALLYT